MTERANPTAGTYDIVEAYFEDRSNGTRLFVESLLTSVTIIQGISSGYMKVVGSFLDLAGAIERFPVRGEEYFVLGIRSNDFGTVKNLDLHVVSIDTVEVLGNNKGVRYQISFMTSMSFEASLTRTIASYTCPVSDAVKNLFERTFSSLTEMSDTDVESFTEIKGWTSGNANVFRTQDNRLLMIEHTHGDTRCLIPRYAPDEAMNFFASRAYSLESVSCSFGFFETTDFYAFTSNEYLTKLGTENNQIKELIYSIADDSTPVGNELQKYRITHLSQPTRVNIQNELWSGAFANRVTILDTLSRTTESVDYSYEPGKFEVAETSHTPSFLTDTFRPENAREFIFMKDYDSRPVQLPGDRHIPEITSNRVSYEYLLQNSSISAKVMGRLDIIPGDLIRLNILEISAESENSGINPQLGGIYMVHTTHHIASRGKLETNLQLFKVSNDG